MRIAVSTAILALVFIYSCRDSSVTGPENNNNMGYYKVLTGESNGVKFELYDSSYTGFVTGYNNLGIRVYINNEEKTSGFVKLNVRMYHTFINESHSTPISPVFNYDAGKKMFTGYASMLMFTDSTSYCLAFFNYNNEKYADSVKFSVAIDTMNQVRGFIDFQTGYSFIFTLISPKYPSVGMNNFKCLFHKTANNVEYYEIDSARMYFRTLKESNNHSSAGNINPVWQGNGFYDGKINLDESGLWFVFDSVKYQDRIITNVPPPKFIFNIP